MKQLFLAIGMALFSAANVAAAQSVLYDCDINQRDERVDWVSPKVAIIVDAAGTAQVVDGVILAFFEKPLRARIINRNGKLRVTWTVAGAYDSRQQKIPQFSYIAVIDSATNAIKLTAKPVGFPQRWTGKGQCVIRKDAKLPRTLR